MPPMSACARYTKERKNDKNEKSTPGGLVPRAIKLNQMILRDISIRLNELKLDARHRAERTANRLSLPENQC